MAFWISVSNILLRGTPKVQWRMEKTPLFKENVDDAVYMAEKHTLSTLFWTRVRSQSYGEWAPPPPRGGGVYTCSKVK